MATAIGFAVHVRSLVLPRVLLVVRARHCLVYCVSCIVYRVSCIVYCLLFKARFESDVLVGFENSKIRISKKQTAADIGDMAETSVSQVSMERTHTKPSSFAESRALNDDRK
jgi:hypothetical protein